MLRGTIHHWKQELGRASPGPMHIIVITTELTRIHEYCQQTELLFIIFELGIWSERLLLRIHSLAFKSSAVLIPGQAQAEACSIDVWLPPAWDKHNGVQDSSTGLTQHLHPACKLNTIVQVWSSVSFLSVVYGKLGRDTIGVSASFHGLRRWTKQVACSNVSWGARWKAPGGIYCFTHVCSDLSDE